uniref:Midasin n=1 Tax=Albugo laibachii Nc14 TaxID=890382 RepID=F0WDW5_9STRA|nr:hypothetical protein CaO19.12161 [Albugo laibachii Nc14]|eukprot:CCA19393.1 hypothetical protein CaO19.12161 [Albugo laibachii Nc14]
MPNKGSIDEYLLSLQWLQTATNRLLQVESKLAQHPMIKQCRDKYGWDTQSFQDDPESSKGLSQLEANAYLQAIASCLVYEPFVVPIVHHLRPFMLDLLVHLLKPSAPIYIISSANEIDIQFARCCDISHAKELIITALSNVLRLLPNTLPIVLQSCKSSSDFLDFLSFSQADNGAEKDTRQRQLCILQTLYRLLCMYPLEFRSCWNFSILMRFCFHSDCRLRWLAARSTAIVLNMSNQARNQFLKSLKVDEKILAAQAVTTIAQNECVVLEMLESTRASIEEFERATRYEEAFVTLLEDGYLDKLFTKVFSKSDQIVPIRPHESLHNIFGVLFQDRYSLALQYLKNEDASRIHQSIIMTRSTKKNIQSLAIAIQSRQPILLTGPSGSGKTAVIREVARLSGNRNNLLEIHLDDQTDTKTLFGSYVCADIQGEFIWQPGAITTAARQGKWILIEDVDRAPFELLAALDPLLESGEMEIPGRGGESIRAHADFQFIATIGGHHNKKRWQLSAWAVIDMDILSQDEYIEILEASYSTIPSFLIDRIMKTFRVVTCESNEDNSMHFWKMARRDYGRIFSLRDLLKWCNRICTFSCTKAMDGSNASGNMFVTEDDRFRILVEAIDVFCAGIRDPSTRIQAACNLASLWDIEHSRVQHHVSEQKPAISSDEYSIKIGRVNLKMQTLRPDNILMLSSGTRLVMTKHTLRFLEKISAAVDIGEPVLLIGETGCGKTAMIQHLAVSLNQPLVVQNLNIQSESSDLIGGYKPVELALIVRPLYLQFVDLFTSTFSQKSNAAYLSLVHDAWKQKDWEKFVRGLRKAIVMARKSLTTKQTAGQSHDTQIVKKQKCTLSHAEPLLLAWNTFQLDLDRFKRQKDQIESHFAFQFVEGVLVQALRHGHWILLDEINLASAETLERISTLLESDQSAFSIVERGDVECIKPHPNFRIFGSMNPSTDVGKRDLPPSLRHRFTEIYVDECLSSQDLEQVVERTLTFQCTGKDNQSISQTIVSFYLETKQLADTKLSDGANQKPHYSLRTLCRALYIANILVQRGYGIPRTLYEAFSSTFCTLLDHDSRTLIDRKIRSTFARQLKPKELSRAPPRPGGRQAEQQYVLVQSYWIPKASYCEPNDWSMSDPMTNQKQFVLTKTVEANLCHIARAAMIGKFPVLLQGPTSAGKTSLIMYLAQRIGQKCIRINNHEHTDLQEYLGAYVSDPKTGKLVFREGGLVQAVRNGWWIILDELNLAPTDVLEALNRLLDDHRELFITETQEVIRPNDRFLLFATQNPPGLYGGRKILSKAFRNRFLEIQMEEVPPKELKEILCQRCAIPPSFCSLLIEIMQVLQYRRQQSHLFAGKSGYITTRDLLRWAERRPLTKLQLAEQGYCLLAERLRKDEEKAVIRQVLEEKCNVHLDIDALYDGQQSREEYDHGVVNEDGEIERETVWGTAAHFQSVQEMIHSGEHSAAAGLQQISVTKSLKRLFSLVGRCLQHGEPVLLVGETGSGKTTVCQLYALLLQQPLYLLNCHQNTETSDIVGCFRPNRKKEELTIKLKTSLQLLVGRLQEHSIKISSGFEQTALEELEMKGDTKLDDVINLYHKLKPKLLPITDDSFEALIASIDALVQRYGSIFEWYDGPLVKSMKEGGILLLDEVNLAQDAVLERLNSVLEPTRTLLLSEKGDSVEEVKAHPKWRILATMNPGGDFGKRELSPALRNRFTEIWVPSAANLNEFEVFVHDRLVHFPKRLQLEPLCGPVLSFIEYFNHLGRVGGRESVSITLRDVLTWIHFVQEVTNEGDIRRSNVDKWVAFVQGAALAILDGLGLGLDQPPQIIKRIRDEAYKKLLEIIPPNESSGRQQALLSLQITENIASSDLISALSASDELSTDEKLFGISPFFIPRNEHCQKSIMFSVRSPATYSNLFRVLRGLQVRRPILLEGSPGVGKSSLIHALAQASGHQLVRINLCEQTDISDLFGSDLPASSGGDESNQDSFAGAFEWSDGVFLRALKAGGWILLDELNLASQSVLEGLNACLDHRGTVYIPELDKSFTCSPNFRIFGAQNPLRQGGGRKGLPKSFLNRFTRVVVECLEESDLLFISESLYPELQELTVDRKDGSKAGLLTLLVQFTMAIHNDTMVFHSYGRQGAPWEFNLRDILRLCELIKEHISRVPDGGSLQSFQESAMYYANLVYISRFRLHSDRDRARARLAEILPQLDSTWLKASPVALHLSPTELRVGRAVLPRRDTLNLQSARSIPPVSLQLLWRPMEALIHCVNQEWPALLVGSPASGKSCSVRLLASLTGHKVHEITLSAGFDASELLGCFEQVDLKRLVHSLHQKIVVVCEGFLPSLMVLLSEERSAGHCERLCETIADTTKLWSGLTRVYKEDRKKMLGIDAGRAASSQTESSTQQMHQIAELLDLLSPFNDRVNLQALRSEYSQLSQMLKNNAGASNAGQFEWLDGTLLQAIECGDWVLLENVNFCPASVLDRLNALLEPNGELVVNECGLVRGQLRIIRPHPDFRIFLSMDAQHGEISRAMRNRCMEIALIPLAYTPSVDGKECTRIVDCKHIVSACGVVSEVLLEGLVAIHSKILEMQHSSINRHNTRTSFSVNFSDINDRNLANWAQLLQNERARMVSTRSALTRSFERAYGRELLQIPGIASALASISTESSNKLQRGEEIQLVRMPFEAMTAPSASLSSVYAVGQDCEQWTLERHFWQLNLLLSSQVSHHNSYEGELSWPDCLAAPEISTSPFVLLQAQKHLYPARVFEKLSHRQALSPFSVLRIVSSLQFDLYKRKPSALADQLLFIYHKFLRCKWKASADLTWIKVVGRFLHGCLNTKSVYRRLSSKFGSLTCQPKQQMLDLLLRFEWYRFCENETYEAVDLAVQAILKASSTHAQKRDDSQRSSKRARVEQESSWTVLQHIYLLHHPQAREIASNGGNDVKYRSLQVLTMQFRENPEEFKLFSTLYTLLRGIEQVMASLALELPNIEQLESLLWKKSVFISILDSIPASCKAQTFDWTHFLIFWSWMYKTWRPVLLKCTSFRPLLNQFEDVQSRLDTILGSKSRKMTLWKYGGHALLPPKVEDWVAWNTLQHIANEYFSLEHRLEALQCGQKAEPNVLNIWTLIYDSLASVNQRTSESQNSMVRVHPILFTDSSTREELLHAFCECNYLRNGEKPQSQQNKVMEFPAVLLEKLTRQCDYVTKWLHDRVFYLNERRGFSGDAYGDTDEDVEGAILVSLKTDQDPRSGVPLGRPILLFDHTQSDPIATRIKQAIVDVQLSALHESNALRLELLTIVSVLCILNAFDLEDKHLDLVEEMVSPLLQTLKECVKALLRLQTRSPASIFIYQDLIWQGRALQATYSEELLHHFVARLRQYLTTILADTHRFLRISSSQNPEVLSLLVHSSRNEKSKEVPSVGTLPSLQHKKMQGFPQVFRNADGAELLRQLECCVKTSTSSASSGSALIESYYLVSRMEGLKDYLFDLPELETPNTEQLAYQYGKELLINTVLAFFQAVPSDKMNLYGQIRSQLKAFREAHSTFQPQTLTDLLLEWNNCCLNTHVRSLILPLLSECNQKNTSELPSVPVDPLAKAVMKKEALLERLAVHTFQHAADQGAIDSGLVDHQLLCPKNAPMVTYKAVEKLKLVATVRFQGKGSVAHAVPGNRFTELFWDVQQLQKTLLSMERIHAILTTASNLHQGLSMSPSSILECQQLLDEVDGMDKTVDSVVVQWRHNYGPSFYDILDPILGAIHLIKEGIALVASSILYKMQNGHDLRTMKRQLVQSLSQTSIPIIPYKYEKQTSYLLKVMPQERSQLGVLFGEEDVDLMLMEHTLYWLLRSFKSGQKAYLNDARVVFDGFLKLWQLRKDEAEAKEKEENALLKYKLRTTEITSDEAVEEAEFRKEYPDYISLDFGTNDLTGKQEMASDSTSNSTLDLARIEILSFYHEQLYGERIDPQCHLDRDSVMRAFALMHKVRHVVGNMPRHQRMDTEIAHLSYLTTIHIQSELKASNQKSDGKAFQHDSNVNEMMRVASPLLQLISKLQSLLRQWPEHAILQQLVTTAIQILHFGIDSPLGRTSSAVQLLLRKAQEWEAYAASQVSIKEELKSLTQIVARWRQLELHAWPHLLELREHKFRSAAKQTWPHLYSILTGNSEMHTECDADMQKYRSLDIPPWCDWVLTSLSTEEDTDQWLCNLFDALDAYLRTSSLGQFQERLTLLHSFYGQLHTEMSSLSFDQGRQTYWLHAWKVKNILYHLRRYYNQHWPFVKREWDRMKAPIQRKLVDFCKLCRWDEQTYYSLQESADKSHRKLLKLCREYEDEVLACPMQSLLDRAMDGQVSQADGFIAIDVTRKELQDAHDLELFTEEDEAPILHLSAATSPSNQMTDISNTFVSQCRYLSQLAKLTRKVVKYTQRDIMSFKHVLLRQNVHYVCESLCASIFDRLQKFKEAASAMANKTSGDAEEPRSYKLPKGAKKKALLDLLSELKAQGFRHLMAQLPSQLQWMLHIFALEAPKINHLELDLSEAKSLNTLTSKLAKGDSIFEPLKWNWDRAEIYYYRLVEQVTALRFRVSKAYSSDLSTHEVIQLRGYSENMLHVCLQQRQVLLQTTRRHVKMVEFLDRFQALKSWCEVHLETDGEDLFVVKEWFARQKETILHLQHPLRELGATISLAIATSQHVCETKESIKSMLEKAFTLSKTLAANVSAEFPPSRNILIENARGIDELLSSLRKLRQLTTRERVIPSFGYGELISYLEEMNKQQSIYAGKSASFKMATEEESSNHTIQPFIKASDSVLETILLAVQALKEIESATQSDGIISRMQRLGHNISQTRIGDILEHLNTLETMLMSMYNKVTENHSSNLSRNALKSSVSTLQALLPPLLQVQLISRQYLVDYILAHKAVVKFSYIVIRVFRNLLEHGFCRAQEEGGDDEDDQDSGEAGKEFDGTGMGQGEGKKDVSDQIEDEEQLLGLRDDPVTNETESVEKKPPEDTGLEMENDFEGTIQDAPDQENEEEDDQDEGEELDREMGDIDPEDANLVDNKLWGEDSDDDDEDIDPEKEKFDENARSDGAKTMEDEIRGKNEDQDTTDSKEDASEAQNQEPETKDEETEPFDEPNEDDAVNADWEDDYENEHGEFDESEPRDPDTEANKPDEELPEDMELDGGEPDRCEDEGQEECDVDSNDEQAAANEVEEEAEEPISPDEQDLTNEDMAKAAGSGDMDTQPEEDPAVIGGNGNSDSTIAEAAGQNGGQSSDKDETMMPDQATEKDKAEEDDPNQAEKPFQNAGDNDSGSNDQWSSNPISSSGEPQQPHSENLSKRESNAPNPYHDRELAREHWKRRVECIERENENDDIDPLRPQTTDFKHAELDADQESMEREGDQFALAPTNENDMQMDDVNSAQEETTNDNEENGSGTGGHAASNEQKTDVPHLDEDKPDDEAVIPNDTTAPMEWDTNEDEVNQDLTNRDSTRTDISQLEQNAEADRQESYNQSIDADLQNEETIPEDEIHSTEMEIQHLRDELDESISAWSQSDSMELSRGVELWCKYKAITLPSSQRLCEQLRLILEPMLRSKLEGDYRTGKRINMRKVIPYIASHFRKDKIWMRRTKPSKRAYQIMIAIDDSESMADNHAGRLALEAMTTLCRALSQLEVGQLSVVKFGHEFQLLHAFDVPFTDDAGGYVISQFGFQQKRTNMIQTIDTILHVLQAAKEQACNTSQSASAPDFTQIVFMISDGRFDTDGRLSVKKLIEKATEQNQLIVLLIVDDHPSSQAGSTAGNSILETKRVQFLNGNIQMIPYLEKYPFPYYVLLPSSQHLPEILSDSLRQWFELLSSRH